MKKIKELIISATEWIKQHRDLVYRVLSIVLIIVMVGSGGFIAVQYIIDRESSEQFEDLQEMVNDTSDITDDIENDHSGDNDDDTEEEEEDYSDSSKDTESGTGEVGAKYEVYNVNGEEIMVPIKNLDWDALHDRNEHIYAWLYVPGTRVDYPVLQHPTENDYYLHKDLDGNFTWDGNIYSQVEYNGTDWTDYHTVLYGHNRRSNGKMFRSLHNFEDGYFFKVYKNVFIYTEKGVYIYEVYAAYVAGNEHQLATYPISSYDGLMRYVEKCMGEAAETGYYREIPEDEQLGRILTLETCNGDDKSVRYVVQAFLVYDPTQE